MYTRALALAWFNSHFFFLDLKKKKKKNFYRIASYLTLKILRKEKRYARVLAC